ncbi:MAG TPA: hypothetical protein VNN21_07270 [Dehalococcoidia bacterium]|nr:hypothetical protein [Dehalococcoidia bacterium]
MILLHPGNPPKAGSAKLAPRRFTSLDGLRVGLLGNTKLNADNILMALGDLLKERYAVKEIVHYKKPTFALPAPQATVDEMAQRCDVVLAGVGD